MNPNVKNLRKLVKKAAEQGRQARIRRLHDLESEAYAAVQRAAMEYKPPVVPDAPPIVRFGRWIREL